MHGIGSFLCDDEEECEERPNQQEASEVDRYLALPQEKMLTSDGHDLDILDWWRHRALNFPNLSRMARQFLALQATSAGCERLFSAAGRSHDDYKKSTSESTLESIMMVHKNLCCD